MKRIILMFLLLAGTINGFAQGTPKYILDTSNSNKGPLMSSNGLPFKSYHNAVLSIYKYSDFPTMPMQGYISDVFFNSFDFTPAGSTIPGLMIKIGKTHLKYFPYLNTTDYSSCIPLVESMVASQKTVYYDSLYTLQSNWWAGQWLKFHLPVPYRYDMQPLPNDTQQNLTMLISREWDYTYPIDSGKFHLSIQWLGFVNDSTRWETTYFYMDSLEHIAMSNFLYPKRCLYFIGFNGYSLSVNDPNKMKPFTVFPNPAQSTLHYSEQPSGLFSVYDMSGKQVLQGNTDSNGEIDIKTLPTGAYLLKIGEQTIRFLKE
ncbi:MAG: T9SS type A sorting domain-containing protein [Bacteroidetes bacterium]|nr:T9SS type A sorting domain-containing protein [Bacteroidota bacterium]MBS1775389.1 T9SS type A sorting domain-containing protein [Bacteroidota bacterium]